MNSAGNQPKSIGNISRVGILGLGLIGGSLAKALRYKANVAAIVAMDTDPTSGENALSEGVIDSFSLPEEGYSIFHGCDLVLLCTPLPVIVHLLPELAALDIGILSDVGSVKTPVMEAVSLPNFVGGHPMAGSERQGYTCSNASLFENALYVLCVGDACSVPSSALRDFEELIKMIGAAPVRMSAQDHDQRVATISHLPHIAATALSLLAARLDDGQLAALAAGGFRDITRIASSNPSLWSGITQASAPSLVPILSIYIDILKQVKKELEKGDSRSVEAFFAQGAFYRNSLPTGGRGALDTTASLTVYLEDKPGALGLITTLLGKRNINIRNINIRNYRTYEGGQLHLLLGDSAQAVEAYSLLKEAGYECD
jgi:prephenate dehydrogenase